MEQYKKSMSALEIMKDMSDEFDRMTNEFEEVQLIKEPLQEGLLKLDNWDKIFSDTSGKIEEKYSSRLNEVNSQLEHIAKAVLCFTFDDGYKDDALTYSILKEYGFVGSFALITNDIYGDAKNSIENYSMYEKDGFEILSHSASHKKTSTNFDEITLLKEFKLSAEKLRDLGFSCNGFVAPYSTISKNNNNYAKTIYDYILIGGSGLNGKDDFKNKQLTRVSQYNLGVDSAKLLIDEAINTKKMLIFYDHRIGQSGSLSEAEFRLILDYVKLKVEQGLISVKNVRDAINEFYHISSKFKDKDFSSKNYAGDLLSNTTYTFIENTCRATRADDINFRNPTKKLNMPSESSVGSVIKYGETIELPYSFDKLGGRVNFSIDVKIGNSQFNYLSHFLEIDFIGKDGNVIDTQTKQIYPNNLDFIPFSMTAYNKNGIDIESIYKIRVSYKCILNTQITVVQNFRLACPNVRFVNQLQ